MRMGNERRRGKEAEAEEEKCVHMYIWVFF